MQPIYVLPDAVTRAQTTQFRALAEATGFASTGTTYPPSYRNNDRVVLDSPTLADELFDTMRAHLPTQIMARDGSTLQLTGLNPRFRFCRYRGGQQFGVHRDGVFHRDHQTHSALTFMIYLNDAGEFDGGHTRFYNGSTPASGLLMSMAPRCGTLIVFDHGLWHDGAPVTRGTKYVMRSDVMYSRIASATRDDLGHLGYVWSLAALPNGHIASGGRDGSVRMWAVTDAGLAPAGRLDDHGSSVSALAVDHGGAMWTGTRRGALRSFDHNRPRARTVHNLECGAILGICPVGGDAVAVATASGTVQLWTRGGRINAFDAHRGWVWGITTTDEGALVTGGEDGLVRMWSQSGSRIKTLCHAGSPVRCVSALADGSIAAGCSDGSLVLMPRIGSATTIAGHTGAIRAIAQASRGQLITAGEDSHVHTWRLSDLAWLHTETHDDFVTSLLPLTDGRVVSAGYDAQIIVWPSHRPDSSDERPQ